ncbi:glycosyltransferase family 2 protein [Candidatus Roizmanbacteria bacterium]|nr:glycosyltransferase family 2 protein [Candidatus Roizmanbacteria bacterium]
MISVIIPFHNEKENLPILFDQLAKELKKNAIKHEIIFVDDGSTDNGSKEIKSDEYPVLQLVQHRKRFGKGRALTTGFSHTKGDIIVFMDADLQNDPADISRLLSKLDEGYDLINGYRKIRNDGVDKTLPSKIYNRLIAALFSFRLHDINCGFKAMRREVLENVTLYGDNYRILPILAKHEGFRIGEIEVTHHPRKFGTSKYGPFRYLFGLFDVVSHFFLLQYFEKPLHFFGGVGSILLSVGMFILLYLGIERIFFQQMLYRRPILFLGLLLVIVGVQIIATGFIGELIVYLNKRGKR